MKTCVKNLFLLSVLIAGLDLILPARVTAQTFTPLYSFTGGSDGEGPGGRLIISGNTLYGTASGGGSSGVGTVFVVNTDGTGFTNLHSFTALSGSAYANSDGARPYAGLILSGNTLYGTAGFGGSSGKGTVFKVSIDGAGFTTLHSFTDTSSYAGLTGNGTNSDGAGPFVAGLILLGNTLYGTAARGGISGNGTVFAVNTDGTGFTTLHSFTAGSGIFPSITNSDGANPVAGLTLSSNTLYGTATGGGSSGFGTVFAVKTDGSGFTNLHSFTGGSDGVGPGAGLILSSNTLCGASATVFKLNTDGTSFTTLYCFPREGRGAFIQFGGLILSGSTLYGTAGNDLIVPSGIVFAVNTDGSGFTTLHSFSGFIDGAIPGDGLSLSGNTLYGTKGGISGHGTVFSLSLVPPQLTIIPSAANVILTWPTNASGFTLQSSTNLASPATWTAVSPGPVVINGQNAATNPISGTQRFYRLSRQ